MYNSSSNWYTNCQLQSKKSNTKYPYLLVIVSHCCSFTQAKPIKNNTSEEVSRALWDTLLPGRWPAKLISDTGTSIATKEIKYILDDANHAIKKHNIQILNSFIEEVKKKPNNDMDNDTSGTQNIHSYREFFSRLPDSVTPPKTPKKSNPRT